MCVCGRSDLLLVRACVWVVYLRKCAIHDWYVSFRYFAIVNFICKVLYVQVVILLPKKCFRFY